MQKTINVTAGDIKKGAMGDCNACPVALATMRAFKGAAAVDVFPTEGDVFYFTGSECTQHFNVLWPDVVRDFIDDFDMGDKVKPFKFTADFALR